MKWITREHAKVDRIACPWLISRFIDPKAEFFFVPAVDVQTRAVELGAIPFDVPGVELGHHEQGGMNFVSFDAFVQKYHFKDPAILALALIVRGADSDMANPPPESAGLKAAAEGFQKNARNDLDNMKLQFPLYDALYSYCKKRIKENHLH